MGMTANALSEAAFKATFEGNMTNVTQESGDCIDIWPYVRMVQESVGLPQRVVDGQLVEHVYRSESGQYDHVLLPAGRFNVFLVIVVDRVQSLVHGHRVLDLNTEYGLDEKGRPKEH
jgi:hypothetical protein